MKAFLLQNGSLIMAIIGWILYFGYLFLFQREKFKKQLYSLMLNAKQRAKDGVLQNAQTQEEWVVKMALQNLPKSFVLFLGEKRIRKMIFKLYVKAMDWADDGKFNVSFTFVPLVPLDLDVQDAPHDESVKTSVDVIVETENITKME